MRIYLAALTLLVALSSDVWAYWNFDSCAMETAVDQSSPVQGAAGDPNHFVCTKDNKCKAYVVLVTFTNKSSGWYEDADQPYGYSWDLFNPGTGNRVVLRGPSGSTNRLHSGQSLGDER